MKRCDPYFDRKSALSMKSIHYNYWTIKSALLNCHRHKSCLDMFLPSILSSFLFLCVKMNIYASGPDVFGSLSYRIRLMFLYGTR